MRRPWRDDEGSATAELAVALPAVVLVLGLCVGMLAAGATRVKLHDVVADAARLVARGEGERAQAAVRRAVPHARAEIRREGEIVCVTAAVEFSLVRIAALPLRAQACALDDAAAAEADP